VGSWAGRIRSIGRTVALVAFGTAVGFVLVELLSRVVLPAGSPLEKIYPADAVRAPEPYTMFGGRPGGRLAYPPGTPERLNGRGYRGAEPAPVKPDGEIRVFVVGGSTVFEGDPPLPVLLEAELHDRGLTAVRCFNYGVLSAVSGQELARIVFEVVDLEPDLVVMFDGGNDLTSPVQYDPRPGYPFNFIVYEANPLLGRDVSAYPKWTLLAYGSNVLRALAPGVFTDRFVDLERVRSEAGYLSPEWRDRIASGYVGNLVKAQRISRAFGSDFSAFFQPLVFFKRTLGHEEQKIAAPLEGFGKMARDLRLRVRLELQRARSRQGLVARDLSDIFDSIEEDMFYDIIHVTRPGKEILARAMAEDVGPRIRGTETPAPER
jgi:lysophospholipase L1-like esterase